MDVFFQKSSATDDWDAPETNSIENGASGAPSATDRRFTSGIETKTASGHSTLCSNAQTQSSLVVCLHKMTSQSVSENDESMDRNILLQTVNVYFPNTKQRSRLTLLRESVTNFKQLTFFEQHRKAEVHAILTILMQKSENGEDVVESVYVVVLGQPS